MKTSIKMKIIETENISKSFGKVQALTNINLHIDKGELFGLIGPDGAGKSTLFNILVTLLNPDSGTAIIHGYDLIRITNKSEKSSDIFPDNSPYTRI